MTEARDLFIVENLHVRVEGREILKGVNLVVPKGEVHAIMGPNGSGKSTLANALMGHPHYEVTAGRVLWKGQNILELSPDERARLGLFMAFQYPVAVPGVSVVQFLRMALKSLRGTDVPVMEFRKLLREKMQLLRVDDSFVNRYLNEGFSGGEKKRNEILQLAVLQPEFAILDETDSGLDIDAVRLVANAVNSMRGPNIGFLIITHYSRILNYIDPDVVHVLVDGRIVRSGGPELAHELEQRGYDWIIEEVATQREA
ncbi:MAG: Fe-S cluster assembly ATPase SufC [Chloroflexota bacterium]